MLGGTFWRTVSALVLLLAVLAAPAAAQQQVVEEDATGWTGFFNRMDTGTVAVVLIFGTGLVAVVGGMIPGIVRACRGDVDNSDELIDRIAHLEHRVASLEQRTPAR